jgi:4-amino-4-deoxy-L-arabinose transferase-like glycosyltransferase
MNNPAATPTSSIDRDRHPAAFRDLALLAVCIAVFFAVFLGNRPLSVPDEGRYVEIPREMVATGNYVTPRLNGVKYFEKPPLFYWFEAGLIKAFGLSEWSVRTAPALFALLGCLAVYYAGLRLFGRAAGIGAAVVLATSTLYYAMGRVITLDMPVTTLLSGALLAFLLGTREPEGAARRVFFLAFYALAALATLTKGLIGIVIPGMIIFWWMLLTTEWRTLRSMHVLSGSVLFLIIAVPWHILVDRANPEFLNFYFIHEHFQRYLTKVHGRYKPFWYFLPVLLVGLFPWSAFLFQAIRRSLPRSWAERKAHKEAIFLLLWAGLVFLFFSASDSKLVPYILPVLPPLALLIGPYLGEVWENGDSSGARGVRTGLVLLLVLSVLLIAGLALLPRFRPELDRTVFRPHLYGIIAVIALGTAATWTLLRRSGPRGALIGLTATTALFCIACSSALPHLDTRSIKGLALELRSRLGPGDEVASYLTYYQDLPVYLERRVTVVDWTGELDFGTKAEDVSGWMMDDDAFWKQWESGRRIYLVTDRKVADLLEQTTKRKYFLIAQDKNNVILSNTEAH